MNIRYRDRLILDEEGDDLPDDGALRDRVHEVARDLIEHTRSDAIRDWFDCAFEVTDEAGTIVLTMPFGESRAEGQDAGAN